MSKHAKHLILASWPLSPNHLTWADSLMCSFLFVSILVIPIGNLSPNLTSYQVSLPTFKPCFTLLVLSFCHKSLLPLISTHSTLPRDASSPVSCTYLDGWSQIFTSSNFPYALHVELSSLSSPSDSHTCILSFVYWLSLVLPSVQISTSHLSQNCNKEKQKCIICYWVVSVALMVSN